MPAPAFGFSVGDFIAAINLVVKISKALKDTNGAATEIKDLLQELQQLELLLEQLKDLPPESSPSLSHLNAVRGMALSVQIPLRDFLGKMEKYRLAATSQSRSNLLRGVGRKVQWIVTMQEDITQLRAVVTMKIVSVSVLLAMPMGKQIYRIQQSVAENRGALENALQDCNETKARLSQDIRETKNEIRRAGNKTRLDTHRLLKICAGLRVGVERLERQRRLEFENEQRAMSTGRAIWAGVIQVRSSVNTLQVSISHSAFLIFEKMLQCKFKGLPGESKVLQGEYHVMNTRPPYQIIPQQDWNRLIFPGSSLDMSILFLEFHSIEGQCPRLACSGTGALNTPTGMLTCPVCNLQYFQVQVDINEKEAAPRVGLGRAQANVGRATLMTQQLYPKIKDFDIPSFHILDDVSNNSTFNKQLKNPELEKEKAEEKEEEKKKNLEELSVRA
ncbi:MAG: hypothetical protein Q9187_006515 [Circinaria calcarea]